MNGIASPLELIHGTFWSGDGVLYIFFTPQPNFPKAQPSHSCKDYLIAVIIMILHPG